MNEEIANCRLPIRILAKIQANTVSCLQSRVLIVETVFLIGNRQSAIGNTERLIALMR
jgi:hypothetical protein